MTRTEKVRLTGQCKEGYGLNQCLQAIGLPKSTYDDVSSPAYRKSPPLSPIHSAELSQVSSIRLEQAPHPLSSRIIEVVEKRTVPSRLLPSCGVADGFCMLPLHLVLSAFHLFRL